MAPTEYKVRAAAAPEGPTAGRSQRHGHPPFLAQLMEMSGELKPEPILTENPGRFVLFPIQHSEVSAVCAG